MPGVCRDNDTAGGDLIPSQSTVKVNGQAVVVHGDSVTPHAPSPPHSTSPTMIASLNSTVKIGGILVCVAGDLATCGHSATGSGTVSIG